VLRFNDLLRIEGVDPRTCKVMLHSPKEPRLRRLLPHLARNRPDLFDAYQATHSDGIARSLANRPVVLVFVDLGGTSVPGEGRDYAFVGHYDVAVRQATAQAILAEPGIKTLVRDFGHRIGETLADGRDRRWFDLRRTGALATYAGRLTIRYMGTPNYVRDAEVLDPMVRALAPDNLLDPPPPDWREMRPTGPEVRVLPERWAALLAQWRGIYLIIDELDGKRYVGSAYGQENLLGRWRAHVAGERGVTVELRRRDPVGFRFSILERVSPDMAAEEVIRLEQTWMDRLHTRDFGLNSGGAVPPERTGNDRVERMADAPDRRAVPGGALVPPAPRAEDVAAPQLPAPRE
jgi:hypothetical protein